MNGAGDAPRSDRRRRGPIRPLRLLSLRARITIGSTAIAAIVILLLVLVMRFQVVSVVASATRTLLDADADPYVATLEVDSDPDLSPPGNAQLVAVVSPSGEIVLSTMPDRVEQALGSLTSTAAGTSIIRVSGSEYRVVVEHPVNQAGRWTVVAARNSQAEAIVVDDLTTTLSLTGLAILLAFGVASWVLATTALRPVNRMRREAERLSVAPERAELPVGPAQDELASLATTLNAFLARTRQATERERQMVSDASHELRTPLAILTTQLDLAALDVDDAAALAAHIERAKHSVARLSRLANDLLALSRIEESERREQDGDQRPETAWSDLGDEVMAAVDRVRLIASAKDVTVDFDLEPPVAVGGSGPGIGGGTVEPHYRIDTGGMAQLVTNIAGNAVAALPRGGGIFVSWRSTGGEGVLQITDDGPGVPESFIPVAFDRFTRPDEARKSRPNPDPSTGAGALPGGSGLGLAIVRAVAERAGGTASLRNVPSGGLEVTVRLPEVR
ncbi:sensor histidine kinase [Curtobacterium aurantiacum]|uniref:histidine kinase n=1 Tax=Curtobacterium aurantiacum TaxID=3236919 RepID=A0ABS5VBD6_9MICO|nr:HAMP domain-containing sensor histidine kinase [Curtobacterium flaccumfaciens]MBT1544140.1 HAMP domain-containing histidine kinase [Curtobacterium flaccumfaciens pv. flaccumfaciens]MBT1586773.1 HAMP domain-containing histidine kinase [Curtobacterium flaccumfaciens pv. flaccumfaciens]MBT1676983.1 HAMP domain-containing histidine kinase [Curtobacterium flaccumfaciens pv. flaccumfaciens]MBT1681047.1 HAMP domain-containing histidine kinase [Curtobacterium flaccumfaciens pv. flaccumfaciens]